MKGALCGGARKRVAVPGEQGVVCRVLEGRCRMLLCRQQALLLGRAPSGGGWLWPVTGCCCLTVCAGE